MKSFYESKESISSCWERNTGSTQGTAPKRTTFFSMFKRLLPLFALLLVSTNGFSQFLYTDHYVYCVGFGNGDKIPPRGIDFTENLDNDPPGNLGPCFRVCENTEVNYWFTEPSGIEGVEWEAEGGVIINDWNTPEHKVLVKWGEAGNGLLTVKIKYSNGQERERVICVEKIPGPEAEFQLAGINDNMSCTNAEVLFENLSVGAIHYLWDFGDYIFPDTNYSSQFEPIHIYKLPGTYTVTLTVINACNCEDVYTMDIHIENAPPMLISCPGVVCENDTVTYTVNDRCPGQWVVEGGHIIAGGTGFDFVEVVWSNLAPNEGFGYIHYRSGCGCPFWTTEKIPVVLQRSEIEGSDTICVGIQERYTLPQWPTTEYNWTLTTDTNPPQLIWSDQRNEVLIEGIEPGNYILHCDYKNTLLGCEGFARKGIRIFPKIEITGEDTFCANTSELHTFTTVLGDPVDWTLTVDGAIMWQETNQVNFTKPFAFGGIYTLTASSSTGCISDPFYITVIDAAMDILEPIVGVQEICQDNTYTYTCSNATPGTVLKWTVTGNAVIQGSDTGSSVSIRYTGAGPYTIKVERVAIGGGVTCFYDADSTLIVKEASFDLEIGGYTSSPTFCSGSNSSFTATFGDVTPDHISWEVLPAGFGSIVSGADGSTVTVIWNEVSGTATTGTVTVKATVCGNTQTDTLTVNLHKTPELAITNIIPDSGLCPDLATIDVAVNVTGINSGTLLFDFGNGTTPQSKPFTSSGNATYTINNLFNNTSATDITQNLKVSIVEPNGCSYSPFVTQAIKIFPQTEITIFPETPTVIICTDNDEYYYPLTANVSTGDTQSSTFQWYKSDVIPATPTSFEPIPLLGTYYEYLINSSIAPNPQGVYKLKVTDQNGCVSYSQEITVIEDCGSGPVTPCTVSPNPNVQIFGQWQTCGVMRAWVTYNYAPSQITWSQSPSMELTSGQGTASAYFSSDVAGAHTATVTLKYGTCELTYTVTIEKNYTPDLHIAVECNDDGTYNLKLSNNSMKYLNPTITYSYQRKLNPIGYSVISSSTNPQHTVSINNLAPGTYTYRLNLTSSGKPSCASEHTITLDPMPDPDIFTVTPDKETYCPNEPIALFIPNFHALDAAGYVFTWNILGYASQIASAGTTEISLATAGFYDISLIIQTPMGCILESNNPVSIEIPSSTYSGTIAPPVVNICEGQTFSGLTYSPAAGTTPPHKVVWMNGSEVAGVTGPSTPFFPTESGLYWVMLEDANACRFANGETTDHTSDVTIRKRPYVDIIGSETLCFGETMTLIGDVTDDTLQRRWLRNGSPMAPYGAWNTSNPFNLEIEGTTAGTYTYTLQVRPATDISCGSSVTHNLTVYPPVPVPEFDYNVLLCEPYTVRLSVISPQPGQYSWSNGTTGAVIEVYIGGAYQVTYTDLKGCTEIYELTVPHHSERYLWMMPKGCFDVCPWDDPAPYIIGPWAEFDYHEWIVNGTVVQDDVDSPVTDITVDQPGTYQLAIEQDGCRYESEITYISPTSEECEIAPCEWEAGIRRITYMPELGIYVVDVSMVLPAGVPMTITFSSFNGYGVYTPGSITLPAGPIPMPPTQTYNFSFTFTPNPGFTGGDDYLVISIPDIPCITLVPVSFRLPGSPYKLMQEDTVISERAFLRVSPNPAGAMVAASYNLGTEYQKAESLKIYTMLGTLVTELDLKANRGDVPLDISRFPSGTYIISLQADGNTILHQKLVKK